LSEPASRIKATPAVAFCFIANTVLARESWARARLEPFAGQGFEVRLPLLAPLSLIVGAGGRIEEGAASPAAILALGGISGDSALADELRYLRKHLRPDVEEELSRFIGDIAAHRLVGAARSFTQWQREALTRLTEAAVDYAVEERRALVRRAELADLAERLRELEQGVARLEERSRQL
jgi:ubiquinone biosynthesis accessory factor UbiJ